jgi:hypothetical protein
LFVARFFFEIPKSQTKIEWTFNIVGMLKSLWRYKLGVDNFDKLVMVMKNWSSDAGQIICDRGIPLMIFSRKKGISLKRMI